MDCQTEPIIKSFMIIWRKINRRLQDTTAGTPIFSLSDGLLLDIVTPIWTRYPAAVFRWGTCFRVQWHGYDSRTSQSTLHWRHNDHDSVSNHQSHGCLLNRLFRRRSKKTSKLRVTGLCVGTGEFPAQRASYAENVSIWWRHHERELGDCNRRRLRAPIIYSSCLADVTVRIWRKHERN